MRGAAAPRRGRPATRTRRGGRSRRHAQLRGSRHGRRTVSGRLARAPRRPSSTSRCASSCPISPSSASPSARRRTCEALRRVRGLDERHLRGTVPDELLAAVAEGLALPRHRLRVPASGDVDRDLRPAVALISAWVGQLGRQLHIDADAARDPSGHRSAPARRRAGRGSRTAGGPRCSGRTSAVSSRVGPRSPSTAAADSSSKIASHPARTPGRRGRHGDHGAPTFGSGGSQDDGLVRSEDAVERPRSRVATLDTAISPAHVVRDRARREVDERPSSVVAGGRALVGEHALGRVEQVKVADLQCGR